MAALDADAIRQSLDEELASAYLYARLEAAEHGRAAALFRDLRVESTKQAQIWARELERAGQAVPDWRPGGRVRLVAWLVGVLGPRRMLPVLSAMKVRGLSIYRGGSTGDAPDPAAPEAIAPSRVVEES